MQDLTLIRFGRGSQLCMHSSRLTIDKIREAPQPFLTVNSRT
jgi:hypothetical protein